MEIDLATLEKAIARLAFALARHAGDPSDEEVRDSVIQRFEFTYDLSHKMLRRVLEATSANAAEIAQLSFPSLIRTGWEEGLVKGGWPAWHRYRDMRNATSHTYDEVKAIEVAAQVPEFLDEATFLAAALARRQEQ